jgi:hypothetical protein
MAEQVPADPEVLRFAMGNRLNRLANPGKLSVTRCPVQKSTGDNKATRGAQGDKFLR